MPDIDFLLQDRRWAKAVYGYKARATKAMNTAARLAAFCEPCVVGLVLANDRFSRPLNHDFRGKDKPTNVLSFPQFNLVPGQALLKVKQPKGQKTLLGEIVLSYETMLRESREQEKNLSDHYAHLIIHGFLHLIGYNHLKDKDAQKMEKLETKIMAALGLADPYSAQRRL